MKFEEFLKAVAPKVGPNSAFDLARDARLEALENLLVGKCGLTQDDIAKANEEQLGLLADRILKMPPLPKD